MLITVSGLDGSGKSTLVEALRREFEARQRRVVICHMNHDLGVYAAIRALRARLGALRRPASAPPTPPSSRASAPRPRKDAPVSSGYRRLRYALVWNKPVRRVLYLVDLLIFLAYRAYTERLRRRVLIMDRYFYDTLVDVAGPRSWKLLRFLARCTPAPALAILLGVGPEEAFARKGEYSVEYLARRWAAYQRIFGWVDSAIILGDVDFSRTPGALARLAEARAERDPGPISEPRLAPGTSANRDTRTWR